MSLFHYKLQESSNKTKPRSVTAKTEAAARLEIQKRHPGLDLLSISVIPNPPKKEAASPTPLPISPKATKAQAAKPNPAPASPKAQAAKASTVKAPASKVVLSKLKNMLFLQHGKCFFCGEPLPEKDASIEHLYPLSKGGKRSEDNEVVCHKSLNGTFGHIALKEKFAFVLKAAGSFKCPK